MCEYMIRKGNQPPICEPLNQLCTLCVMGNMKTHDEIENSKRIKGLKDGAKK